MPYLLRRLEENSDIMGAVGKQRNMIWGELKRRWGMGRAIAAWWVRESLNKYTQMEWKSSLECPRFQKHEEAVLRCALFCFFSLLVLLAHALTRKHTPVSLRIPVALEDTIFSLPHPSTPHPSPHTWSEDLGGAEDRGELSLRFEPQVCWSWCGVAGTRGCGKIWYGGDENYFQQLLRGASGGRLCLCVDVYVHLYIYICLWVDI